MVGCLEQQQKDQNKIESLTIDQSKATTNVDQLSSGELKAKMNCLEKLFNNDNFYFINQKDTQFVYFTRLNETSIFTHSYKMFQGDSTQLKVDTIQQNKNSIVWKWNKEEVYLDSVSNKIARWVNKKNQSIVEFIKNEKSEIHFIDESHQQFRLIKTPQISLFLSRSFYDYKNGTHFAFDTSNFTKNH